MIWFDCKEKRPSRFIAGPKDDCGIQQFIDINTGIVYAGSPSSITPVLTQKGKPQMIDHWYLRFRIHMADLPKLCSKLTLRNMTWMDGEKKRSHALLGVEDYEACKKENKLETNVGTKVNAGYAVGKSVYDVTITGCEPSYLVHVNFPPEINPYNLAEQFGEPYMEITGSGVEV